MHAPEGEKRLDRAGQRVTGPALRQTCEKTAHFASYIAIFLSSIAI
jgi:hypothetical protein